MSYQDQEFQQRWGFRRNESDLDSSSNDHSGPSSTSEPKPKKHKLVSHKSFEENNQETTKNLQEPNPSCKNLQSKGEVRQQKPKRISSDYETFDAGLNDLRDYTESLIEGIKVARDGLLIWMSKEMEKSIQTDMVSSKPSGKGRARGSKSATNSPAKRKRKSATTRKRNSRSSETVKGKATSDPATQQVVGTPKEPEVIPTTTNPVASTQKQKRKRSGLCEKKQKEVTDQKTHKATAVAPAPNYLTLPTVLPRPQVENRRENLTTDGKGRDFGERNTLNSAINLCSQAQLTNFPRLQEKDGVFAQNGLRNMSYYEQNIGPKTGNGNGNGNQSGNVFPFPLHQGLNGGIGIPTNTSQLGLQFLTQENRIPGLRMNGGPTRLPHGNHTFVQNYGDLDQHLRFQV